MAGSTDQSRKIYNFTPHAVTYVDAARTIVFPSNGSVRLNSGVENVVTDRRQLAYNGHALTTVMPQELDDLDTASKELLRQCNTGDSIIVSQMVGALLERVYDHHFVGIRVYAPATGPSHVVRDADNRIRGVKAFEYYTTIKCLTADHVIVARKGGVLSLPVHEAAREGDCVAIATGRLPDGIACAALAEQQRHVAHDTLRLPPMSSAASGAAKYKYTVETLLAYGTIVKQRQDSARAYHRARSSLRATDDRYEFVCRSDLY